MCGPFYLESVLDTTSLVLAVDSTQVNSASAALQKMAGEGFKAETVVAKLANSATLQGRALNTGIVKNAAAAADSIKGLTSATSALSSAQDFSRTTAGLAAAASQANAATGAMRAFGVAVTAAASADFSAPQVASRNTTVQQIAQAPVSVAARQAPAAIIDNRGAVAASGSLDKFTGQTSKAESAVERLTAAAREQGNALGSSVAANAEKAATAVNSLALAAGAAGAASGITATSSALDSAAAKANAAAASVGNMQAAAARAANGTQFNPFAGVGVAASNAAKGVGQLGQAQKLTADQTRQLSFQLNDFFVQVSSGQSPLTALIQQGSQLNGTFGGTKGTIAALASLITPTTVALGGAAAAVGGLAYAYMQGAAQSKAFNDAIILSGNYAGQTNGSINRLAESVAESTKSSIGNVREFANALISTGEIGPRAMGLATDAVVRYGEATGKTAQEAAADFAKMARDPAKFAQELNKSWNAWTAAELDAIKAMQEGGQVGDAQVEVLKRMQERLQGLHKNLGDVEGAQRTLSTAMGSLKDAFFAIGRDRTLEDRLKALQGILSQPVSDGFFASIDSAIKKGLNAVNGALGASKQKRENFFANSTDAREESRSLQGENFRKLDRENERALAAEREKRDIAADSVIDPVMKAAKTYKRVEDNPEFQKAKTKLESAFKDKADNGRAIPKVEQDAAIAQLRKQYAPPKASSAGANEASQVLREQLADDLGVFKAALAAEKETLAFHQREMQGVYQAGGTSLKAFFDDKRASITDGVKAEIGELDKEIARLKEYQAAIKDPSEKVKVGKQINQLGTEKVKLQTAADRDTKLTNQEETASFKALNDQIVNYNANLLQMQGDEIGAARLRAQVTIDNARILAAQGAKDAAGNPVNVDVSALQRAIAISNDFAEVQRRAGDLAQNTARAEEAAYMVAELGGKSLAEQENALYAVRSRSLDQLGVLAAKAKELAEASTDPKIKAFAADLALQYAKAAEAVDPALNRLREAQRNLAAGITTTIDIGVAGFGPAYSEQRKTANDEIKTERDKYDQKINILEGYLATTRDKNDQARLREKIKNLEAQKDSVKGESKTGSFLKTIDKQFVQPIAGQALATVNKLLITDPLNEYLKGQFKSLTEGEGLFAGVFKSTMGIKDAKVDPKVLAEQAAATATTTLSNTLTTQTSAVQASTLALEALANAANAAAGTVGGSKPLTVEPGSRQAVPSMGDFTRADRALEASQSPSADPATTAALVDARTSTERFADTAQSAGTVVTALASSAAKSGSALGALPGIINTINAMMAASSAGKAGGGSGGGLIGSIINAGISYFGGTSAPLQVETVASGAVSADYKEMPNFLRGGRELGGPVSANSLYRVNEKGPEMLEMDGKQFLMMGPQGGRVISNGALSERFKAPADDGSVSALLRNISGSKGEEVGESSASVLGGLLARMGVKDEDHSRSGVLKVAGARELGGPVSAGKLYRVNENRPELLNVGNKQYLMMGAQGGSVDPNPGARGQGGGAVQHLNVTVAMPQGANAATANQFGVIAGRQMQNAIRRNG
jgi:hypothetical protein